MESGRSLETLPFDNTYAGLPDAFYSKLNPTPFSEPPHLVSVSLDAAALIDLDPAEAERPEFPLVFGGSLLPPATDPLAMLYAGHQFGVYVPRLGDGRAILLGEVRNRAGETWDLHLKGAGRTPYSRDGDGRAVLRSAIREYLCSEAMHGLGIPTSRALCVVGSREPVRREMVETGAMLLRLCPSHVRFGTFEFFAHRRQYDHLAVLSDYVVAQDFPELMGLPDRHATLFQEVVTRTARLVARWQAVGFAHGVMNTDNMSILGVTLDYGPFGFMDDYDPGFICNHSDHEGRYAFDRQPDIAFWNLGALAHALLPLVPREALAELLNGFRATFDAEYWSLMQGKLGLRTSKSEDATLLAELFRLMQISRADYTRTFRTLSLVSEAPGETAGEVRDWCIDPRALDAWLRRYRARLREEGHDEDERRTGMNRVNPKYVLRNYLAQQAIERAQAGDYSEVDRLLTLLQDPYGEQPERESYAAAPPNWGKHLVVSCSS